MKKQIDYNDLRIGNLVKIENDVNESRFVTVYNLDDIGINVEHEVEYAYTIKTYQGCFSSFLDDNEKFSHDNIKSWGTVLPVEINGYWLNNLGFKKDGDVWSFGMISLRPALEGYDYYIGQDGGRIIYVNDLQNIVHALSGVDLTIKSRELIEDDYNEFNVV